MINKNEFIMKVSAETLAHSKADHRHFEYDPKEAVREAEELWKILEERGYTESNTDNKS